MNCLPFLGHEKWEAVHMRQRAPLFKIIYASQVSTVNSWLGAGSPA